jgi:hypothetical protein
MSIDRTILQYKELEQLQEFAQAQQKTIIQLSKKLQKSEDEKAHLEKLLASSVPLIREEGKPLAEKMLTTSEEAICVMQLDKLRDISTARELTLEETRRVEIFSKILSTFRNMPKTIEIKSKQLSNEELLSLVENTDDVARK